MIAALIYFSMAGLIGLRCLGFAIVSPTSLTKDFQQKKKSVGLTLAFMSIIAAGSSLMGMLDLAVEYLRPFSTT